jgi:predicted CxxxxCH...CXXCH cytochrome family protein
MFNAANANCSAAGCHSEAGAHPARWQGTNDNSPDYHSTHTVVSRNTIDTGCAMCHQVAADGPQPNNKAPSCFSASITYGDGATIGCHANGPGLAHDIPYNTPELHGAEAKADLASCQVCHGTPGETDFSGGSSGISCADCHADAGAHPTRWIGDNDTTIDYKSSHRDAGKQSTACAICHDVVEGNPRPNANAPSCFSNSREYPDGSSSSCHSSGPGAPHPVPYPLLQHGADAKDNLAGCVSCHATPADAGAGGNPRFNVAIGDLVNGCEDCHAANTAHPTPLWTGAAATGHATASRMSTACVLCHGTSLDGPAGGGVGPACTQCHTAGSPLTLTNCTSCHNWPPDGQSPAGDRYPNRVGAHAVHNALAGVDGNCAVCHEGAGTESVLHFNGGDAASISLASTYDAQSGAASYNAADKTCGTTRCHGGQTTPDWFNGSVDMGSDCQSCHSTSPGQYNAATSGKHSLHARWMSCTECHDPAKLEDRHHSNLATPGFEGDPGETLNDSLGYNPTTRSGCSASRCHDEPEPW